MSKMQNKSCVTIGLLLSTLLLSACSMFGSQSEYDKVPPGKALEVPPDLDAPSAASAVRVPNSTYSRVANGPVRAGAPVGSGVPESPQGNRLETVDGGQVLVIDDSLESVWRRTGFALQRIGLDIEDQERDRGVYSIEYVDSDAKEQRPGKFSRWIMRKKGPTDHSGTYQIQLLELGEFTQVRLLNDQGQTAAEPVAEEILGNLLERLE